MTLTASMRRILKETAAKHGLPESDIVGERRFKRIIVARHDFFHRLCTETTMSYSAIGARLGLDHTSVRNGRLRHEDRLRRGIQMPAVAPTAHVPTTPEPVVRLQPLRRKALPYAGYDRTEVPFKWLETQGGVDDR